MGDADNQLHYVVDLAIGRDDLWELWTVARRLTDWLCASAALDPVVGGRLLLDWQREPVVGEVLSIDAPRQLLMEWRVGNQLTQVEVQIFPTLDGSRLEVRHRGLLDQTERAAADRRWQVALERLKSMG